MTLRAVIFDLGGTLLHYHDPLNGDPKRPFYRVTMLGAMDVLARLSAEGVSVPSPEQVSEAVDRQIGQTFRALASVQGGGTVETPIQAALAELGIPLDDQAWASLRPAYYEQISQTVSPRVGVRETLDTLRQSYALGLISNTFWAADLHDRHLINYHLLDALPVRIYSCDMPHSKPHPSIFEVALAQMGVMAGEAAYVGDRLDVDVAGAQGAGMRGILIRSPYEDVPLDGTHPDAIINELPELPAALEKLA